MESFDKNSTILAIDIGSTKTCAVIAELKGGPHITGTGIAKSNGLKKGAITNIELASRSIKAAVGDAKRIAGAELNRAIVSISGAYTKSQNSHGIVNVPDREITSKEINRAIQTALYNANIPADYETIHVLPYNFKIDDQDLIEDPIDMSGNRLEVHVHIVAAQKSSLENLRKAVKLAGLEIDNIVLSAYASSIAVLNDDEKELGVVVMDIGGATSNIAVHLGNSIRYNDFLAVGSAHITNDLSMALHTPLKDAENVKIEYGSLNVTSNDVIELPVVGNDNDRQEVSLEIVSNVIYARAEETLMILAKSLEKSGFKNSLGAGVVFTGGMTKLDGLRDLAVAVFDGFPVRFAKPNNTEGLFDLLKDPSYSTVIGLVKYASGEHTLYEIDSNKKLRYKEEEAGEGKESLFNDIKNQLFEEEASKTGQPKRMAPNGQSKFLEKSTKKEAVENLMQHIDFPERRDGGVKNPFSRMWRWATQLF
jgi:cell division protein FtsA